MRRDIRNTAAFKEAAAVYETLWQPGSGLVSDATDLHVAHHGRCAAFSGTIVSDLCGEITTRIGEVDLESAEIKILTSGAHSDRLPKYSADGCRLAFLSDRHAKGDFQLYFLCLQTNAIDRAPQVDGWVEYFHWSADGSRILLGVAGYGADTSSGQGAVASARDADSVPAWAPDVETGDEAYRWRSVWIHECGTDQVQPITSNGLNIWEAVWCGVDEILAVASEGPTEGDWYSSKLFCIDQVTGRARIVFVPDEQIGWLASPPSGERMVIVESVASDRGYVCGEAHVIDKAGSQVRRLDTKAIDVSYVEWRSEAHLLIAGHRGLQTVVGVYDVDAERFTETWSSQELTTGGSYAAVRGLNESGDCVLVGESFTRSPEFAMILGGRYETVKPLQEPEPTTPVGSIEALSWRAPDGLEMEGWLLTPLGAAPHAVVMNVHGGPIWHWRPTWLGRRILLLLLLAHGYAVFFPNPRGSSGRGPAFARRVVGDMGGADTNDLLSGLDELVKRGLADPRRLGVIGISYGGTMAAWLVTRNDRFAAAVSVAAATNYISAHLLSNIPEWLKLFLQDDYTDPRGQYLTRSPVMYADRVRTPVLNICGTLDRCSPPQEAVQFHRALRANGIHSVLVTYPQEGHGIRGLPALIDYAARVATWFDEHLVERTVSVAPC